MNTIELKDITFGYSNEKNVFKGLNFVLKEGEKVGIIGPNGSGKTTLLHLIVGILKPVRGEVKIFDKIRKDEKDFKEVREKIGLVFQNPDDQLFSLTVAEDIAFGPLNLGRPRDEIYKIIKDTLAALGLHGFEDRVTYRLSEGEKKLVAIGTVLSMKPQVLLLDEPTTDLDERNRERIIDIIKGLSASYIITSHDMDLLQKTTNTIYRLKDSKLNVISI
ncbi:cobalt ABC transporter ATPase [Candidatus Desulfofervidus auxilii]|uniref:ABC transporter ATP-binding protein n=1 Tax=Desulfofervidus auxilii TaxID=1621989 RepID=A0A7V0IAL0_DESA2|nr:ABC transporter ATP-binding protein [Candidatus Desulfofervidus auxilii]RKY42122.1 MAG: ABC transporter ATP-binding protein [Candidatus Omnitrophota bacterium]CAD7769583.1 Energy-coupling factor transporter ATP-binding protein EcfA3 [Candidatus Methanoperedenaceae archaeon GB50]AMM39959.1 cobalt ABC transporter ATPase [Candidatus Desulfofervidus auxilii]CAD7783097.1 MAG: Energy-coupling factor transporter ATP-binding protein EcfA3 [Candidatus Methanoperedenaceae archaeon GB50]HDD35773.1 ABC